MRDEIFGGNQEIYDLVGWTSAMGSVALANYALYMYEISARTALSSTDDILSYYGDDTWISDEGLVYGPGSIDGNRVDHVLQHTVPDPSKPTHTVFNVSGNNVFRLLDEAWRIRGDGFLQPNGNVRYDIEMGRIIGTNGETMITIITEGFSDNIITAFPTG